MSNSGKRSRITDDRGSAAVALGFALLAAALVTVMASLAVGVSMTTGAAAAASAINSAIDARYDTYIDDLRSSSAPSTAESCVLSTNSCATITGVTGSQLTFTASYANGSYTDTQVRRYVTKTGSAIAGFDSKNNPVWGPAAADPPIMTTIWDTSISGCSTITMPMWGVVNAVIDWGDGAETAANSGYPGHTYSGATGPKSVTVNGTFTAWGATSGWSYQCITDVLAWGETGTTSTAKGFHRAANLKSIVEPPDTVTDMNSMFNSATTFNADITNWDTSRVTDMNYMFYNTAQFNQDIGRWDTGNVADMRGMFDTATAFNQNVSGWNTKNVSTMNYMFIRASSFDNGGQPWLLSANQWSIESVADRADIDAMFLQATSFSRDLSSWVPAFSGTPSNFGFTGARAPAWK